MVSPVPRVALTEVLVVVVVTAVLETMPTEMLSVALAGRAEMAVILTINLPADRVEAETEVPAGWAEQTD